MGQEEGEGPGSTEDILDWDMWQEGEGPGSTEDIPDWDTGQELNCILTGHRAGKRRGI